MNNRQEVVKTRIIACLGSGMNHTEIAKTIGCSTKTVQRFAKSIKPAMKDIADSLSEYQRLLRERLPIKKRVEIYSEIAQKVKSNPFAAMRALERIDDLDGVLTAKDETRRPSQDVGEMRPMFILPEGCRISVEAKVPDAIDITPKVQKQIEESENKS
jgi:hypothetical protein